MSKSNSNKKDHETWRLNAETKLSTSLWAQVIKKLGIDNTEQRRNSLYNIWHLKRHKIVQLVEIELKRKNRNIIDGDDGDISRIEEVSVREDNNAHLLPDPSLPLPEPPNTRTKQPGTINGNNTECSIVSETSFILTPSEWKAAFSCAQKKLNDGWTKIFYDKIIPCGITCSCTGKYCTRSYLIKLTDQADFNTSPILHVQISGTERHDAKIETMSRQLCGEERYRVGERANEIGPLAVFRERVEAADENLLAEGNYTGCETIEVLKKTVADYHIDEESVTLLFDHKKTLKEAKKENDKLRVVDEYFRSSTAIIHQSPFNVEAIQRYPHLKTLINNKLKYDKIVNPLFSPLLIRIFYRWWAYLPLWTDLLWNFEQRYSNSLQTNASVIYNPIRHSNALVENYFRTLKSSMLKNKVATQPQKIIAELYRSVQIQLKAIKYEVTQSSKEYMLTTAQPSYHPEVLIDGHLMRWPRFGIKEAIFRGRSYTLTNTCHIDSALFALYFYI
ncbi:unnamed protein product [Rotaria sordida]|uniref:Uncharacterized protein n=1 Tax=Rotaria sordida TaxID=392033 RepID=A0A814L8G4_9BILA|nr:unnamed protein product [Rotaria sordida]CAF1232415.1 unnamed protein product [Rotaria sordida]